MIDKRSSARREPFSRLIAAAVLATGLMAGAASAAGPAGDPASGAKLFLQCRACHNVVAGGPNGVGPNLFGVTGAKAASQKGYKYSPALVKSGLVWSPQTLDSWLKRPTALVPGTKMVSSVAAPKARQDIIAYLATLKGKQALK